MFGPALVDAYYIVMIVTGAIGCAAMVKTAWPNVWPWRQSGDEDVDVEAGMPLEEKHSRVSRHPKHVQTKATAHDTMIGLEEAYFCVMIATGLVGAAATCMQVALGQTPRQHRRRP